MTKTIALDCLRVHILRPFEDSNGRVARAIADQALAQAEESGQRFYSMSRQIRNERSVYYDTLERTQKGELDITPWLLWFLGCFSRAIDDAEAASSRPRNGPRWASARFPPRNVTSMP